MKKELIAQSQLNFIEFSNLVICKNVLYSNTNHKIMITYKDTRFYILLITRNLNFKLKKVV
jgi:hypothetical protein